MEPLYSFRSPLFERPASGLVQTRDGWIYGVLRDEQKNESAVYRLSADGAFSTVAGFDRTALGPRELASFTLAKNGELLCFTPGALFKLTGDGTIARVGASDSPGEIDTPRVQAADGNFYATSRFSGVHHSGSIIRTSPEGTTATLVSFGRTDDPPQPWYPVGTLAESMDGFLFGVCHQGGAHGRGAVFKVSFGGELTVIYSFDGQNGSFPLGGLIRGQDGNFYGTTAEVDLVDERAVGNGTVFRITPTGEITSLHRFGVTGGAYPRAALVQGPDGVLHGTTSGVDDDDWQRIGTIFSVRTNGEFLREVSLDWGTFVQGTGLTLLNDGSLLALTAAGGEFNAGSVVKLSASGKLSTLHSFRKLTDPAGFPLTGLSAGPDGAYYGTSINGGNGFGTVFKLTQMGEFSTLFSFSGTNGSRPEAALTRAPDGNFYGVTLQGGKADLGVVYRITPAGEFVLLHSFDEATSGWSRLPLIVGPDQRLYGAADGLTSKYATFFAVATNGNFAPIRQFARGGFIFGSLILGNDGAFYGTSEIGGNFGRGSIFRLTTDGEFARLYSFTGKDGKAPTQLVQLPDGTFLGITEAGDTRGTVFRLNLDRTLDTLFRFSYLEGQRANPLVFGKDGALYGTFYQAGQSGEGSLFRITLAGELKVLHSFYGSSGARPVGALVVGDDGSLYGVTSGGGDYRQGLIFRHGPSVWLELSRNDDNITLSWPSFFERFKLESSSDLSSALWQSVTNVPGRSVSNLTVTLPAGTGQRFFRLKE